MSPSLALPATVLLSTAVPSLFMMACTSQTVSPRRFFSTFKLILGESNEKSSVGMQLSGRGFA